MNVAAYCRVSTDSEDQINSLENQEKFFYEYIRKNSDWTLAKVFSDEGVSGTSVMRRVGFNLMIKEALEGKIDLIITKEVSRFARNTVDTLKYTRELRANNVGVLFINDNINTLDNDGEFRLSIMASVAQEESRKISSRVKWGMLRQMERGDVFVPPMLGFETNNGKLIVNQNEAIIVQKIFSMFVNGMSYSQISRFLIEEGIKPPKRIKSWNYSLVSRILRNEKYVGDVLLRKTVVTDYLTHSSKKNNGIVDKIFFENHHEPIVSREVWNMAQQRIHKNTAKIVNTDKSSYSNRYWCSGKVFCSDCGNIFVTKSKKAQYGTIRAWRCKNKSMSCANGIQCNNGTIIDDRILLECMRFVIKKISLDETKILNTMSSLFAKSETFSFNLQKKINEEIEKAELKRAKLLDLLIDGVISKEDYANSQKSINENISLYKQELEKNKSKNEKYVEIKKKTSEIIEQSKKYLNQTVHTPKLYEEILNKIVVYPNKRIDIYIYIFPEPYRVTYNRTGRGANYKVSCFDFSEEE